MAEKKELGHVQNWYVGKLWFWLN